MKTANFNFLLFLFEANKQQRLMNTTDSVSTLHGEVWN